MASRPEPFTRGVLGAAAAAVVATLLVIGDPLATTPAVAALALSWSRRARGRVELRSERGSIMLEVLVGSLLLAMTTAAVLNGMDGAQEIGRENRDRSAAATLVQQDLERMRAMPPSVLSTLDQTRTVTVAGVGYTVSSSTAWVSDASGFVSCTSSQTTKPEYLELTSTAHSPAGADAPVTGTSLLTPPPGIFGSGLGTAAVSLIDRDAEPVAGTSVTLESTGSGGTYTATTNELGCAVFAFIPVGNWTASVGGGLVTWTGETAESVLSVAEGKTSVSQLEVDQAASLRASFVTPDGQPTPWASFSVSNAKLPGGMRSFPSETAHTSKDAEGLFPFLDGYGVFAGTCIANNPAVWDPDYFATSGYGAVVLDPSEQLEPVTVMLPRLAVTVGRSGSTAGFQAARVRIRQIDSEHECEDFAYDSGVVTGTWTGSQTYATTVVLPFGNYQVCAAYRTGSSSSTWRERKSGGSGMPANPNLTSGVEASAAMVFSSTSGSTETGDCDPW